MVSIRLSGKTVSRVLSRMIIYLGRALPRGSSDLPESRRADVCSLLGLASDGVYNARPVTGPAVVSYTAISPLPVWAVSFLLHWSSGFPARTLSGILPCEARTFLSPRMTYQAGQRSSVLPDIILENKKRRVNRKYNEQTNQICALIMDNIIIYSNDLVKKTN